MPKYEIVSVGSYSNLQAIYNISDDNSIFALEIGGAKLSYTDDAKDIIINIFENDEKVGFVYTDVLRVEDNMYLSHIKGNMDSLLQSSLFFKKCDGFPIEEACSQEEKDVASFIQNALMNMGYIYEHLAEVLTILAVSK